MRVRVSISKSLVKSRARPKSLLERAAHVRAQTREEVGEGIIVLCPAVVLLVPAVPTVRRRAGEPGKPAVSTSIVRAA